MGSRAIACGVERMYFCGEILEVKILTMAEKRIPIGTLEVASLGDFGKPERLQEALGEDVRVESVAGGRVRVLAPEGLRDEVGRRISEVRVAVQDGVGWQRRHSAGGEEALMGPDNFGGGHGC